MNFAFTILLLFNSAFETHHALPAPCSAPDDGWVRAAEKVYLQTDRTLYRPGETIWMKVFLTDSDMRTGTGQLSDIAYVEILDSRGKSLGRYPIYRHHHFELAYALYHGAPEGVYRLMATW